MMPRPTFCARTWNILRSAGWSLLCSLAASGSYASPAGPWIQPTGSGFRPKVGEAVAWRFGPSREAPKDLAIIGIQAEPGPFGTLLRGKPGEDLRWEGQVLGRQFRAGTVTVRARDLAACKQANEATLALAAKQAADLGSASVTGLECERFNVPLPDFDAVQVFLWVLGDSAELQSPTRSAESLASAARCAEDACGKARRAAPHAAPLLRRGVIGGVLDPGLCGAETSFDACRSQGKNCLWSVGLCVDRAAHLEANQ